MGRPNLGDPPAKKNPVEAGTSNRADFKTTERRQNAAERAAMQGTVSDRLREAARTDGLVA